jgi:hypothetical protein
LRDALKYIVLSLPEPARKSAVVRAQQAVEGLDATSAMIRWDQAIWNSKEQDQEQTIALGRRASIREILRRR